MVYIAHLARILFTLLGVPLATVGALVLVQAFTTEGIESYANAAQASAMLAAGSVMLMTAFLAELVIQKHQP